jgi:hypothetical protein
VYTRLPRRIAMTTALMLLTTILVVSFPGAALAAPPVTKLGSTTGAQTLTAGVTSRARSPPRQRHRLDHVLDLGERNDASRSKRVSGLRSHGGRLAEAPDRGRAFDLERSATLVPSEMANSP